MKHSRVKLFVKADYLTSKADISHIIFPLVKSWLAFGSRKSFFNHWIYIYNCFCWYIIQIVEDRCYLSSEVKHATSCNEIIKNTESFLDKGWFSSQNIQYRIRRICQKGIYPMWWVQLFLHRAAPKRNATVWNQGFGISPNNCVDHVWAKCLPFQYTKLYIFFVWTNVANNSFAQIMASSLCTLDRFQYAPLRAFILKEVVRYLLSHVKVCVKSYRGIPTNRMHRMPTNSILYNLIMASR